MRSRQTDRQGGRRPVSHSGAINSQMATLGGGHVECTAEIPKQMTGQGGVLIEVCGMGHIFVKKEFPRGSSLNSRHLKNLPRS